MSSNPIGPTGPHGSDETLKEPVTTTGGTAAKTAKQETEAIGPTGPRSAEEKPTQPAD